MDWQIAAVIGLFVLSLVIVPYLFRRPKDKERYARMSDRELVATNTQARTMKRRSRVTGYLVFAVLLLGGTLARDAIGNWRQFVLVAVIVFLSLLVGARIFSEIELLTTSEMDFRKFQGQKEAGDRPGAVPIR